MSNASKPTSSPRVSVATIVKNDADGLSQTLQCIEGIADQIVVVDTGSSDNTREVARQFGANVVDFEWCDDFSAARNHALAHVDSDLVLWLDAGETICQTQTIELKRAITGGQVNPASAYMMVVKPPAAPGVIAAEQVARLRLIPNRQGVRFQGRIRESLHETLDNVGIAIDGLPFRIIRGPRDHDETIKRGRAQRNLRLADLEARQQQRSPQLLNCLAEAAQTLGNTQTAIDLYGECLEADSTASCERLEAFYGLLTSLDGTPGARAAQLSLCIKALEQFPLDAQLLCAMGGYLQADDRIDLAIRSYQTAFEYGRVNPLVWHLDEITAIAAVCWSAALQTQGKDDESLQVLQTAIEREGSTPRLARAMMELHIKHGRKDDALSQIVHIVTSDEAQALLKLAVTGAVLASGQQWAPALTLLQQALDGGCRDITCLRWLAIARLSAGDADAARQILALWQQTHAGDPEPLRILQALNAPEPTTPPDVKADRRIDSPAAAASSTMHAAQSAIPTAGAHR